MKRKLLVALLLSVVLLASCAPPQEDTYKVMLILRSWSSEASVDMTQGANAAAKKHGVTLITKVIPKEDEASQQAELLLSAADNGFDAIVLEPVCVGIVQDAVLAARDDGLTVVTLNSKEQVNQNSTVDIDEEQMAELVVGQIRAMVGEDSKVLMLNCMDAYDNTERLNAILIQKIDATHGMSWDNIDFYINDYEGMDNSLKYSIPRQRDKLVILALNNYATSIAVNRLKQIDGGSDINLITFSKSTGIIGQLERGWVDGICVNRYVATGYRAVEEACAAVEGTELSDEVLLPSVFVSRENLFDADIQKLIFPVL